MYSSRSPGLICASARGPLRVHTGVPLVVDVAYLNPKSM